MEIKMKRYKAYFLYPSILPTVPSLLLFPLSPVPHRSDILPFLDRVSYLCLGDVVYTGSTRHMIDYFRSIGFPCPELENPLMYYRKYRTTL